MIFLQITSQDTPTPMSSFQKRYPSNSQWSSHRHFYEEIFGDCISIMSIQILTLSDKKEIPKFQSGKRFSRRAKELQADTIGNYMLGKQIGRGSYGKVLEATNIVTRTKVLAKVLPVFFQTENNRTETSMNPIKIDPRVENQFLIQQSLDHPNIAKVYGVVRDIELVYIFMEYCQKGELYDFLKRDGPFTHELAGRVFSQIFSAVKYMHSLGIAHRDIKVENVVFDQNMNAKLIDFGLAKRYEASGDKEYLKTFCGSPSYNCPEILKKQKYTGELADVWSLGVTLYAMLEASLPFDAANPRLSAYNIINYIWHTADASPDEAVELYKGIFAPQKKRWSLKDIEQSSYFQRYCNFKEKSSTQRLPNIKRDSQESINFIKLTQTVTKSVKDFKKTATPRKSSLEGSMSNRKHYNSADFKVRLTPAKMVDRRCTPHRKFIPKPHCIPA